MLTNEHRRLIGLVPITSQDERINFSKSSDGEIAIYIRDNQVIKLVQVKEHSYKEIDYELPLDDERKIIGRKGSKPKPLTFENIMRNKTKKMRLKVEKKYRKYELKIGIIHFPIMYFEQLTPTVEAFQKKLIELFGSLQAWEQKKTIGMKQARSRYSAKEGDIFSYPVNGTQYRFALIIGNFTRFRKNNMMPTDRMHYLNLMMCMPLVIRSFDFLSEQNQVDPAILRRHKLLNPEIIMDDHVLNGTYPVIGNVKLKMNDIVLPMNFSFNGPHTTHAGYHSYKLTYWEILNTFQNEIIVRFDWGGASVTMEAAEFLKKVAIKELAFKPINGLGLGPCSLNKNQLVSPDTIFSEKELKYIFDVLDIKTDYDFDQFNEKYGGITRRNYLSWQ